ncbi:hypothetical protein AZE42_11432, partial [Rhizopogon vesiculosus]
MQDQLDGGISLLVCCPGFKAGRSLSPEQVAVDLYITPRELHENSARIGGDVAVLVQAFCEEFVIPHMQHFNERCRIENVEPPHRYKAEQIVPHGPSFLPAPLVATGAHIQCSGLPAQTIEEKLRASHNTTSSLPESTAVRSAISVKTPQTQIRQRRHAEVFWEKTPLHTVLNSTALNVLHSSEFSPAPKLSLSPLISIGPNTDVILDHFKLGDNILPKLHLLIMTVCSSRWEERLRSPAWDLNYEQAFKLAAALHMDLGLVSRTHGAAVK